MANFRDSLKSSDNYVALAHEPYPDPYCYNYHINYRPDKIRTLDIRHSLYLNLRCCLRPLGHNGRLSLGSYFSIKNLTSV